MSREGIQVGIPGIAIRGLLIGDLGHITSRQALLYAREYGWNIEYEALVAGLFSAFVRDFDPQLESSMIAVRGDQIVGSVFLFRGDEPKVAKLRLLYVEPVERGNGLGEVLVRSCIAAARERGYERLDLWTQDCLEGARRIYAKTGFQRVSAERKRAFGHDMISEIWSLVL